MVSGSSMSIPKAKPIEEARGKASPVYPINMTVCSQASNNYPSTYLKLAMTLEQQHIHDTYFIDISMPLKFLPDLRSDCRNGHIESVHGLDLR